MQSKSAALRDQISEWDAKIQAAGNLSERNQLEAERNELNNQLQVVLAEEAQQQAHEGRVQEATTEITTRLDTLYLGGKTLREMCADEEAYQILRISLTQDYISQATKNSEVLSKVQADYREEIKYAHERTEELEKQNSKLLHENHKLSIEFVDIENRFKAAELLLSEAPSGEETDKLKQKVVDLTAQLELKAKAEEPKGDAKSQIDALVQERESKKTKVTNLRLADPYKINTRDYLANDALTGEELEINSNYLQMYKAITIEEAEQLRADEANKKAEAEQLEASIPFTQELQVDPVNPVLEEEAPAEENSFQEEVAAANNTGLQEDQGNSIMESVVEQNQVITLESLHERVKALELKVAA